MFGSRPVTLFDCIVAAAITLIAISLITLGHYQARYGADVTLTEVVSGLYKQWHRSR